MSVPDPLRRPLLEEVRPLVVRVHHRPTVGAVRAVLLARLCWTPPGDPDGIAALCRCLDQDRGGDADLVHVRLVAYAARGRDPAMVAWACSSYAGDLERWGEEEAARVFGELGLRWVPARERGLSVQLLAQLARLDRKAGRWDSALSRWATIESLGHEAQDQVTVLRAALGRAVVYRHRGNVAAAEREIQRVRREAGPDERHLVAMAANNYGVILEERGQYADAAITYWEAVQLAQTPEEFLRSLSNLGIALRCVGCYAGARAALERVERETPDAGDRWNAAVELLEIASAQGHRLEAAQRRRTLLDALPQLRPAVAVDALYRIGLAAARLGQSERAQLYWHRGLLLAQQAQLGKWILRLEGYLEQGPPAPPEEPAPQAVAVDLDVQVLLAGVAAGHLAFAGLGVRPGPRRISASADRERDEQEGQGEE